MPKVDFGTKQVADSYREDHDEYICDDDDARLKTVVFTGDTPDKVLESAERAAAEEKGEKAEGSGQVALDETEKNRFDFSRDGLNVPKLRSIKAIALDKGVSDWTSYVDPDLTVDEHRDVLDRPGARSGDRQLDAGESVEEKAGDAAGKADLEECNHAEGHCKRGDPEACEFLTDRCEFDDDLVDEIMSDETVDATEGLPGPVYGALSGLWSQYKAGISNAKEAAAGINEIREQFDQEPIEFTELGGRTIYPGDIEGREMAEDTHRDPDDRLPSPVTGGNEREMGRDRHRDPEDRLPSNVWAKPKNSPADAGALAQMAGSIDQWEYDGEQATKRGGETAPKWQWTRETERFEPGPEKVTVYPTERGWPDVYQASIANLDLLEKKNLGGGGPVDAMSVALEYMQNHPEGIPHGTFKTGTTNGQRRARTMGQQTHRNPADLTPEEQAETLRQAAEILETPGTVQADLFRNQKQAEGQARLAGGETGETETQIENPENPGGIMADKRVETRSERTTGTETRQRKFSGVPDDPGQGSLGGTSKPPEAPDSVGPFEAIENPKIDGIQFRYANEGGAGVLINDEGWLVANDESGSGHYLTWEPMPEQAKKKAAEFLEGKRERDVRNVARSETELTDSDIRRATNNQVKGQPAKALAKRYDDLDDIRRANGRELGTIDGVGKSTVKSLGRQL